VGKGGVKGKWGGGASGDNLLQNRFFSLEKFFVLVVVVFYADEICVLMLTVLSGFFLFDSFQQ
jgi:hypothetical protein